MKLRKACLPIGMLKPNMILAEAIIGQNKKTIAEAKEKLDTDIISQMLRRNIKFAFVFIHDERDDETIAREVKEAKERTSYIFREPTTPEREALKQAVLSYRIESAI